MRFHSQTVQAISEEFVTRRKQFKKAKLRWRVSNPKSPKYSLGWVPFKSSAITCRSGQVWFAGQAISLWDSYGLADYALNGEGGRTLGSGNFSQDARGRWYLNLVVQTHSWPKAEDLAKASPSALGIDLGLKEFLTGSDGTKVEVQKFYRGSESNLAVAQRANRKKRVKAIHAKIANQRKDALHKLSTALVGNHQAIFVGNVNASAQAKRAKPKDPDAVAKGHKRGKKRNGKSVLDAGWSAFRTMLQYKCDSAGVWFKEVNESYTTQDCSCCGARCGPKGQAELHVRAWTCSVCGTHHDRDVNAATNIKVRGLVWLEGEFEEKFSTAAEARADETAVNKGAEKAAPGVGHDPLAVGILAL